MHDLFQLSEENEAFRKIARSGKYSFADGHYVMNHLRYVTEIRENGQEARKLTPWANTHVDQCCLRFQRIFVQTGPGKYEYGRLNCDMAYIERTLFFLQKQNPGREIIDEGAEKMHYLADFPESFREDMKQVMRQAGVTSEQMAEAMNVEDRTFRRWMSDPGKQFTIDFVVMICLILKTPEWLSYTLLENARLKLNRKSGRDMALAEILRARDDGIESANRYLRERHYEVLSV